jgi:hypothetical protein
MQKETTRIILDYRDLVISSSLTFHEIRSSLPLGEGMMLARPGTSIAEHDFTLDGKISQDGSAAE